MWFDGITGNIGKAISPNSPYEISSGGTGPATFSFWVNSWQTNFGSSALSITSKGNPSINSERLFELRVNGTATNRLEFVYRDQSLNFHVFASGIRFIRNSNEWRHVVFTYTYATGSSATFWIDGAKVAAGWTSGTGNQPPFIVDSEEFRIGGGISGPWPGSINDFCIWTNILTDAQINLLYTSRLKRSPIQISRLSQICYYPCDNGKDTESLPTANNFIQDWSVLRIPINVSPTTRCLAERVNSYPPNE